MKKLILTIFSLGLALSLSVQAEELKVTTLETKQVNYENGRLGASYFKIICINGYQFLYTMYGKGDGSTTQMFYSPKSGNSNISTKPSTPLKCNGYEETRD